MFATTGGMGREATLFYKCLADQISKMNNTTYCKTMAWIRCTLLFSLLRSAVMCIRGSRSTSHRVPGMPALNWALQRAGSLAKSLQSSFMVLLPLYLYFYTSLSFINTDGSIPALKTLPGKVIPQTFPRAARRVWGPD